MCWRGSPFVAAQIWGTPVSSDLDAAQEVDYSSGHVHVTTIRKYQTKYIQDQRTLLRPNWLPANTTQNFGHQRLPGFQDGQFHLEQPLVQRANIDQF